MEKKFESAKEYVTEAVEKLQKSIALKDAADEALEELRASYGEFDVDEVLENPIAKPYWEKLDLEEKAKGLLISFMFDIKEPEHAYDDEETFPQHALDCLGRFKETGDIEEIKKAYWYLREYHDFEESIAL